MPITEEQFEKDLLEIKDQLKSINKNTKHGLWKSFFSGTLSGLGSIIGVAVALAAVAWILNTMGVIPAFRGEITKINQALDQLNQSR